MVSNAAEIEGSRSENQASLAFTSNLWKRVYAEVHVWFIYTTTHTKDVEVEISHPGISKASPSSIILISRFLKEGFQLWLRIVGWEVSLDNKGNKMRDLHIYSTEASNRTMPQSLIRSPDKCLSLLKQYLFSI